MDERDEPREGASFPIVGVRDNADGLVLLCLGERAKELIDRVMGTAALARQELQRPRTMTEAVWGRGLPVWSRLEQRANRNA